MQFFIRAIVTLIVFAHSLTWADEGIKISQYDIGRATNTLELSDVTIQRIYIPSILKTRFPISVDLEGTNYRANLEIDRVISDGKPMIAVGDGLTTSQFEKIDPARLFSVHPRVPPGSKGVFRGAFLHIDGGLLGNVQLSDSDANGAELEGTTRRYFIVPVKTVLPDRNYSSDLHFVYSEEDVLPNNGGPSCNLNTQSYPIGASATSSSTTSSSSLAGCSVSVPPFVKGDIAVVTDYCYWAKLPGGNNSEKQALASQLIQHAILDANLPYGPLGVKFNIRLIYFKNGPISNCNQTSQLSAYSFLADLESIWPNISSIAGPNIAHASMFVGKPWTDALILGMASPMVGGGAPNTCNSSAFFSVENFSMLTTSTAPPSPNFVRSHHFNPVISHELAHNWAVPHCNDSGIVTPFCGLMSGTGYSSFVGMPAGLFDTNSANVITCNKSAPCLTSVSGDSPPAVVPNIEPFNSSSLNSSYWDYGTGISFPGNGRLRFSGNYSTQTYDTASLVSRRFRLPSIDPYDPKQLVIKLSIPKTASNIGSVIHLELLDKTLLWRNVYRTRIAQLPSSPITEITAKVPIDVIDPADFRLRLSVDLAPGEFIELDSVEFTTRSLKVPVQLELAHQVSVDDLDGDGMDELLVSEPDTYFGMGEIRIYSGSFTAQKKSLYGISGQRLGESFAVVRDLNGDGYPELAVGIPSSYQGMYIGTPRIEFYRGQDIHSSGAMQMLPQTITAPTGISFPGPIRGIKDLNGDGVTDIFVGVPDDFNPSGIRTGAVHLYSGATGGLITKVYGISNGDKFGCSIDVADSTRYPSNFIPYLLVGMCGPTGSFRYARLFQATLDSSNNMPLIRTESEAALSNIIPGVSGDSRFGETVHFGSQNRTSSAIPLVGLPGTRYDGNGQVVSAGAIYQFYPVPFEPGKMLAVGGPNDKGFGSAIGTSALWEEHASGVTTTSYGATTGAVNNTVSMNISRNGVQEIATFIRNAPLYTAPKMKVALGDLDGDLQTDYVFSEKTSGCSSYSACSKTFIYLSNGTSPSEPRGAGHFKSGTGTFLNAFSSSLLTANTPFSGLTNNGVVTFNLRMAAVGALERDFMFIGSAVVKTDTLGPGVTGLFGSNNNLVIPEFIIELPALPIDPWYPQGSASNSTDFNYLQSNTFSFHNNSLISGTYYHQAVRVALGSSGLVIFPRNIVKINY